MRRIVYKPIWLTKTDDLALNTFDNCALAYNCSPTTWKRFSDDVFVVWRHGSAALDLFLDFLNNLDDTGKIKCTMQVADKNGLEFLDLKLKIIEGKIKVDACSKPANSFAYVLPSTCYPCKIIRKVPKGIALRLWHICHTDEKHNERTSKYQKYLIVREYNPTLLKKQFEEDVKMAKTQARTSKQKPNHVKKINFLTSYNPSLPCMNIHFKKYLHLLHNNDTLKTLFPTETFNVVYMRKKKS